MFSAIAILSFAAFVNAGVLELRTNSPNNVYLPPSSSINTYSSSSAFNAIPAARQIAIVRQTNENNGDGTFTYSYETEDGQTAEARGQLQADGAEGIQNTQGSYSFTAPDGVRYSVTYSAGANGFEAQGAHLPVPPPIPEAILKSLAENAANEARGIFDDGSYREESTIGQRNNIGVTQVNYQHTQQVQQGGYQYQHGGYQQVVPSRQFRI